jgi:glycosyltransferase involved in cell wall biosynthesis
MAPERDDARRVLMIAYFFPPLGGAGVQRALKFAKYLPSAGWRPTVLTTRSRVYPVKDATLSRELSPSMRVIRACEPRGAMGPAALLSWLGLEQASRIAAFPDAQVGWIPDAVRRAMRAVRDERPAAIFSTAAPFSAHLVALAVHRRSGIPWVADFRDEWSANPYLRDHPAVVHALARRLERAITTNASAVTVVEGYFDISNPRGLPIVAIPNGVDEDDLETAWLPPTREDRFTMTYVGSLYGERDPTPVLEALERLARRGAIDFTNVRVRIVGSDLGGVERRWPVPVEQIGYVSHTDALREMRSASVLLLYEAPASFAPAGKTYEYLASARPVVCVARLDGRAAALVNAAAAGPTASPEDGAGIEQAILGLYDRWRTTGLPDQLHVRDWVLARYSRRKLAADLAAVLDDAAGASGPVQAAISPAASCLSIPLEDP